MKPAVIAFVFVALLMGCSAPSDELLFSDNYFCSEILTVDEVLKDASKWNGQVVNLVGYLAVGEQSVLLFNRSRVTGPGACHIWIGAPCSGVVFHGISKLNGKYVFIRGKFNAEQSGMFDYHDGLIECYEYISVIGEPK